MSAIDEETTEFRAQARWVRTAPRKAQAVVSEIRGLSVADARTTLRFMTRGAARDVAKVLDSAVANAESHPLSSYDADSLYVSAAYVGSGPSLKRWRARARGRVGRIRKRTCHITVRLAPIPGAEALPPPPAAEAPARRGRRKAEVEAPVEAPPAEEAGVAAAVATGEAAVEEVEAPVEETPEEKPKRSRRPTPPVEEAEPAAEEPAAEEEPATEDPAAEEQPAAEQAPKRRRTSKPKDPQAEAPAEEGPAAEEAPAEEKPKPARRSRKKTEDSSPEGDA